MIQEDGTVTTKVIENPYFLENDVWNVNMVGEIPQFREQLSNYRHSNKNV